VGRNGARVGVDGRGVDVGGRDVAVGGKDVAVGGVNNRQESDPMRARQNKRKCAFLFMSILQLKRRKGTPAVISTA